MPQTLTRKASGGTGTTSYECASRMSGAFTGQLTHDSSGGFREKPCGHLEAERHAEQDAADAAAGVVVEQVGRGSAHMPRCDACGKAMRQRRIERSATAVTVQFFCDCDPSSEACRKRTKERIERQMRRRTDADERERKRLKEMGVAIVTRPSDLERRAEIDAWVDRCAKDMRARLDVMTAKRVFEDPCEPHNAWLPCGECGTPQRPDTVPAVAQPPICGACGEVMGMDDAEAVHVRKINVEFSCGCLDGD